MKLRTVIEKATMGLGAFIKTLDFINLLCISTLGLVRKFAMRDESKLITGVEEAESFIFLLLSNTLAV